MIWTPTTIAGNGDAVALERLLHPWRQTRASRVSSAQVGEVYRARKGRDRPRENGR